MQQYHELIQEVLEHGEETTNRTATKTLSIFGAQKRYNLREGFPLLTTKKIFTKGVIYELLWFLKGSNNINYLKAHDVKIWDAWADSHGNLGPVYGVQWRRWPKGAIHSIDQIANVIKEIKQNPKSRRLIVNSWNVAQVDEMALPPCHTMFQFHVNGKKELSCQLYQRSADIFLGVPFNIASYALLTHMVAQVCDLKVGDFVHTMGDAHIYTNHINQCKILLEREPFPLPELWLNPEVKDIDKFKFEDIKINNYECHPTLKGAVAV